MESPQAKAMLFALTSPHPDISIEDFNAWYDTRHAPSRAACPGFHCVSRFHANDNETSPWTWLAIYELENEDALHSEAYKQARADDGDDEQNMFDFLSRRVYNLLSDKRQQAYNEVASTSSQHSRLMLMEAATPDTNVGPKQFLAHVEQQYVPVIADKTGWLRSSIWELIDARDPRTGDQKQTKTAQYLILHEFEHGAEPVVKSSPDGLAGLSDKDDFERRELKLWKQF